MQKKNIAVILLMNFLQGMVFYAAIATLYRQAAGVTVFQITLIESISLVLSMALELPWGMLAEHMGYRRTMVICSFVYFLSKIVFWQADSFGAFLVERVLLAVALAGLSGVDESILYASCPEEKLQQVLGNCRALGIAGLMISSVVCTVFVGENYRLAGLMTMVAYGLAAVASLFLTETRPPERELRPVLASFAAVLRQMLHTPGLLALVLASALFGEVIQTVTVFFNQLQYQRCGWGSTMIGVAYILSNLAEMGSVGSAWLTRRLGEGRTGLVLLLMASICCGLLAWTENGWLSMGCILLLCLLSALYFPLSGAVENRLITTADRTTALSVSSLISDSVAVVLNLLLGKAVDASLPLALGLGGGLCVVAAGLFFRAKGHLHSSSAVL